MGPSMVIPTAPCGQPHAWEPPGWKRCCLLGLGASGLPMIGEAASSFFAESLCRGGLSGLKVMERWHSPSHGVGQGY